ncbi:hypothetical protein N7456_000262 [Penicillium angulare]|uniref:Uncharacterized protein n=1 Tax=Penicillium angulare TaxID=116970 RepID=A0A9W9GBV3_9EURO|nr:hypothetical protein N7456_000262 [Penicillium angulare]
MDESSGDHVPRGEWHRREMILTEEPSNHLLLTRYGNPDFKSFSTPLDLAIMAESPVRDVNWRNIGKVSPVMREKARAPAVQQFGYECPVPCDHCARGSGPFAACVVGVVDNFEYSLMFQGTCASCAYGGKQKRSSFRQNPLTLPPAIFDRLMVVAPNHPYLAMRRDAATARLTTTDAEGNDEETSQDTAYETTNEGNHGEAGEAIGGNQDVDRKESVRASGPSERLRSSSIGINASNPTAKAKPFSQSLQIQRPVFEKTSRGPHYDAKWYTSPLDDLLCSRPSTRGTTIPPKRHIRSSRRFRSESTLTRNV